jgi:hypothetical protein
MAVLRVTVEDLEKGTKRIRNLEKGDYIVICAPPCYQYDTQIYGTGTHVITVKALTRFSGAKQMKRVESHDP